MKLLFQTLISLLVPFALLAQSQDINQLKDKVRSETNDTATLFLLNDIIEFYSETNPDSTYLYAERANNTAQKLSLKLEQVHALGKMGYALNNKGNYPRALQTFLSAVAIAENPISEKNILSSSYPPPDEFTHRKTAAINQRFDKLSHIYQYMGLLYSNMNNLPKAISYEEKALSLANQTNNVKLQCIINSALGRMYFLSKKYDSAFLLQNKAYNLAIKENYERYLGTMLLNIGRVLLSQGKRHVAAQYFIRASKASKEQKYFRGVVASNLLLADYYKQEQKKDSVFIYINDALSTAQTLDAPDLLLRSYRSLSDFYTTYTNADSIVKYQSLIIKINDSLFNAKQAQQFQNIDYDEQQKTLSLEQEKAALRNRIKLYSLLIGLAVLLIVAVVLYRNNKQKLKANKKLETALGELKAAQSQLIHSEKMASLGELTAGIAHEIQNPLNFVNNFSEVNKELLTEMNEEISKGNYEEVKSIAKDITDNEEKINHHGRRADGIVKGMLQHSRSSTGQKEMTDINILCDEYLRLSYHGLRAKDKTFNAKFETSLDYSIEKINVMPQEIGRVILNLINNAFYVVNEKKKTGNERYEPMVSVSTKKENNKILITVADNGNGIPAAIKEKIFQPFFTTKPTGQGTGLGLSLSYDIITKGHGGELKLQTKEGEGSIFTIELPM